MTRHARPSTRPQALRAVLGLGVAAIAGATLTGCAGPLSIADEGDICVVAATGELAIVGGAFEVSGTDPIVIDEVRLADPAGVRLVESALLQSSDGTVLTAAPYPPDASVNWDARVPAVEATASPLGIHSLALVVERTAADATAAGIEIVYTVGDSEHVVQTEYTITVADSCAVDVP